MHHKKLSHRAINTITHIITHVNIASSHMSSNPHIYSNTMFAHRIHRQPISQQHVRSHAILSLCIFMSMELPFRINYLIFSVILCSVSSFMVDVSTSNSYTCIDENTCFRNKGQLHIAGLHER